MSERLERALLYTLRNEDSTLSGKVYKTPGDKGGRTRYGLAEAGHPELSVVGFYEDTIPQNAAYEVAVEAYGTGYWNPMRGDEFISEQVAIKLFDAEVNLGQRGKDIAHPGAFRIFQTALNACGAALTCDGIIGIQTVAAANNIPPDQLLPAFVQALEEDYHNIVARVPADSIFLKGWLVRAQELPPADTP